MASCDKLTEGASQDGADKGNGFIGRMCRLLGRRVSLWLAGYRQAEVDGVSILDPREDGLEAPGEYTKWDLDAIRQSDWVFAYLETSNPGGYALALEVGFATALSKKILLVDEKSVTDATLARSLAMLHVCSDACLSSLEEGIEYMKNVQVQSAARRGTSGA